MKAFYPNCMSHKVSKKGMSHKKMLIHAQLFPERHLLDQLVSGQLAQWQSWRFSLVHPRCPQFESWRECSSCIENWKNKKCGSLNKNCNSVMRSILVEKWSIMQLKVPKPLPDATDWLDQTDKTEDWNLVSSICCDAFKPLIKHGHVCNDTNIL